MIGGMLNPEITRYVFDRIGAGLVCYLISSPDARRAALVSMDRSQARRLLVAYFCARKIESAGWGTADTRRWFKRPIPRLDHQSPAELIREWPPPAIGYRLLYAAREFARYGWG